MRKIVLSGEECGRLIPHWPSVDMEKLDRLRNIVLRGSRYNGFNGRAVMSCPAILIDSEGFILNGRHRSLHSFLYGQSLEACEIRDEREIYHHVPRECFGGYSTAHIARTLEMKKIFQDFCRDKGIYSVADLVKFA